MKKTHPFGPKSRVSEDGVPYLIIPIRWGTPGNNGEQRVGFKNVMPRSVYNTVVKYKKMRTLVDAQESSIRTPNARGQMVGRAQYNKGYDQLKGSGNGNMRGMVRSTDDTGGDKSGGYFTFRVISANSPAHSWIRRAVPPRPVTRALAENTREEINSMVALAAIKDFSL